MNTIRDKLNRLVTTKNDIKQAIIEKGQEIADTDLFSSYASKILSIETGGVESNITPEQKINIINAINGQGIQISHDATFEEIADKIALIDGTIRYVFEDALKKYIELTRKISIGNIISEEVIVSCIDDTNAVFNETLAISIDLNKKNIEIMG